MEDEVVLTLQEQFDQHCPLLHTVDEVNTHIFENEADLVVLFALAPTLCSFSNKLETTTIREATEPMAATKHAKFYRLHLEKADVNAIERLGNISQSPTTLFFLQGQQVGTFVGSNVDKLVGSIRNNMVQRNEKMAEYDLQKEEEEEARRLAEEHEESEEVEEGHEDEDEE